MKKENSTTKEADLREELAMAGDPQIAERSQRFFKTGKGEYGEGDLFRGIRVPQQRKLAKKYRDISLASAEKLLQSSFHEDRLTALFILTLKYKKADAPTKKRIYQLYLDNTHKINNWDLVDSSAEHIVGDFLKDKDRSVLYELAASDMLWERRIAILATFHYIKRGEFGETLKVVEKLLSDKEDLIHKAAGWMLREIGKRNLASEEKFLKKHAPKMPRVMLRYAIERFPEEKRQAYLKKRESGQTRQNVRANKGETMSKPTFFGFPPETLNFLRELSLNNNRQWFKEHKKDYQDFVLSPAKEFITVVGQRLREISPGVIYDPATNGRGSLMRIHRDLRFSKDKTPYHTHIHFIFWQGPGKKTESPAFYFGLDLNGTQAGAGQYVFPKAVMEKYRQAILDPESGPELENIIGSLSENKYEIKGEQYKRAPKGYDINHERIDLLRYKGLSAWGTLMDWDKASSADLADTCLKSFGEMASLHGWLAKLV